MRYSSHLYLGVAAATLIQPWQHGVVVAAWAYSVAVLGALLPDIDHPKSWIGSRIPVLPTLLQRTTGHRGFTHSIAALAFVCLLSFFLWFELPLPQEAAKTIGFALSVGYLSHLVADFFTNKGIAALWPIRRRFGIPLTNTGTSLESVIVVLAVAATVYFTAMDLGVVRAPLAMLTRGG